MCGCECVCACEGDQRRSSLGSGFRVQGAGCRVQGSGFRVQGSEYRVQGAGFRVQGSGCRVQGSGHSLRLGFRHQGKSPGIRVKRLGVRDKGAGVCQLERHIRADYRHSLVKIYQYQYCVL